MTITDTQRANLRTLADFLMSTAPPPGFDMGSYLSYKDSEYDYRRNVGLYSVTPDREVYHTCGTTACAVGHGPLAGIEPIENEISWNDYAERAFGAKAGSCDDDPLWIWLFDGRWRHLDNTAHGAARRIYRFLEHGLPETFNPVHLDAETYEEIFNVEQA